MSLLDRLDQAVLGRWCPLETLGWACVLVGTGLFGGAVVTVTGLLVLKDVIR